MFAPPSGPNAGNFMVIHAGLVLARLQGTQSGLLVRQMAESLSKGGTLNGRPLRHAHQAW